MNIKKIFQNVKKEIERKKLVYILLAVLFIFHLFFRFYELEKRAQFTWDQVDNAWNAKNIIINGEYPLTGMPAKGNSSVTIGPAYYYFVTFFYFLTDLDPIASPIIAGVVSIFSFFVLFLAARKVFNEYVALIAIFINTFSNYLIEIDRVQWPVNFIAPISLLIYLSILKIIKGNLKYILLLAFLLGVSLHIHFTSIFYVLIVILSLMLFPRKKSTILYVFYSIPLFSVWLISFFLSLSSKGSSLNIVSFLSENSVGLHLRRVIQVADVAFLESSLIFNEKIPYFLKYLSLPLFVLVYYLRLRSKSFPTIYVSVIWFLVPWVGLSMFKGELTPYYFSITKYIVILLISYVIYEAIRFRKKIFTPFVGVLAMIFLIANISAFSTYKTDGMDKLKRDAYDDFKHSRGNEFTYGSAKTYLYYFYEYRAYGKK